MNRKISENGLALIKRFEGLRLTAYQDSVGVWTIGYGHTSSVSEGQTITQTQADAYLRADCANAEKAVNRYMAVYQWNQNQFDALVSFTYNCGAGNLRTLLDAAVEVFAGAPVKWAAFHTFRFNVNGVGLKQSDEE